MQGGDWTAFYRKCKSRDRMADFGSVAAKLEVLAVQPSLGKGK